VEEIADISLTDPAKLMNLELSFKFLEYRGEY
jgi:DNA-binding PucR family transcriptional regulator